MLNVEVHLLSQSKPIIRRNVANAYIKNGMYCVYIDPDLYRIPPNQEEALVECSAPYVEKYPMCNIFRVKEDY